MTVVPLRPRSPSRFSGKDLKSLLGEPVAGLYDDDAWDLAGHRDNASSPKRRLHFAIFPGDLRDALKELVILATRPELHVDVTTDLMGIRPKDLKTVVRWLPGLAADLGWLRERAGLLAEVAQPDLEAWKGQSGFTIDYRRLGAVKAFARYSQAMSPGVDRLRCEPWPGQSALSVAGGPAVLKRINSTAPLSVSEQLGPWLTCAMFLVEHGNDIVQACVEVQQGKIAKGIRVLNTEGTQTDWLGWPLDRVGADRLLVQLAGACMFVTAAFTGMRATELDAVSRLRPLESIEVAGTKRWLLRSYLIKGLERPREENWLVPPIVADAVRVLERLLDATAVPMDRMYAPTKQPPLFDRRALSLQNKDGSVSTMRLSRAISAVGQAGKALSAQKLVMSLPTKVDEKGHVVLDEPNGRELRRTFARIVSSRPEGPQAAMEQFKWQHPETAAGYFRVAPDAIALGQRDLYEEVADLYEDVVVDAMVTEYDVWEKATQQGIEPDLPAGPDGRRKRDMFTAVQTALQSEPRIEEDDRRLRQLLRLHAGSIQLTEFGWCDWDENLALCAGGESGPVEARCQPNRCLNHTTTGATLPAHQVKHDRLVSLSKDRAMPTLVRQQARENADIIQSDVGHLFGVADE